MRTMPSGGEEAVPAATVPAKKAGKDSKASQRVTGRTIFEKWSEAWEIDCDIS